MCGIAGIVLPQPEPVDRELLQAMHAQLVHRGPDDEGTWYHPGVGFAFRRLAIVDLSERGHQPMEFQGLTLVFNGEVYNYRELRVELEQFGHKFYSDTDSEVVLHAYQQWGESALQRFNGMFAFAIFDTKTRTLFCARDRLGIKPFYYAHRPASFVFASEPKSLLTDPSLRQLHVPNMVRFLGEGLVDDETATFFDGIQALPAAHYLQLHEGTLKLTRYWDLQEEARRQAVTTMELGGPRFQAAPEGYFPEIEGLEEAADELRSLLCDSVRLRLRSDVPVGTCLSGGLDSSSIVSLASRLKNEPVCTFSSIYPQRDCNEENFVRHVVEGFQTDATRVEPVADNLPNVFSKIAWFQDEPTAGPGLYSQWHVMDAAREKVTVLLDGQGGDELLAGYHYYFTDYLTTLAQDLVRQGGRQGELLGVVPVIDEVTGRAHTEVASKAWKRARRPSFLKLFRRERPGKIKASPLFNRDFATSITPRDQIRTTPNRPFQETLNQRLYSDLTRYSIPCLLRYEDRNSMAFSLEARTPFLDHRLVEFCFALPFRLKISPPHTKLLLRKAMETWLPEPVLTRSDKMGYPTPASHWFRGPLKEWIEELIHGRSLKEHGLLDPEACQRSLQRHLEGEDRSWELWRIASVEAWMTLFLDGEGFRNPIRA